jgi:hypothetical protein
MGRVGYVLLASADQTGLKRLPGLWSKSWRYMAALLFNLMSTREDMVSTILRL